MDRKEFLTTLGFGIGAAATMSFPSSKEKLPQKNKRIDDKWCTKLEELRRGDVVSFEDNLEKLYVYHGETSFRDLESGKFRDYKDTDKMYLLFHAVSSDLKSNH